MEGRRWRPAERAGPVRFRTTFRNVIYDVFKARGWRETESETEWDVAWIDPGWLRDLFDATHLEEQQVINHFRNHYELTRKDLLAKNLKRMQRALVREDRLAEAAAFDFFPLTFVLPADYGLFVEEFKQQAGAIWIMKPVGKAQGKGIFLFNRLSQISDWKKDAKWRPPAHATSSAALGDAQQPQQAETYIVQRYLENPLLVGGKKFDLRLYALVTSFQPLTVRSRAPGRLWCAASHATPPTRRARPYPRRRSTSTARASRASPRRATR